MIACMNGWVPAPLGDGCMDVWVNACSFWALAGKKPMQYNKKKREGAEERIQLLAEKIPIAYEIFTKSLFHYSRQEVALDDIPDALVLALTASHYDDLSTLPPNPQRDAEGLVMEIVYAC
ncbi:DUF429 domain-containing protein [Bacteroidota bacterium]